MLTERSIAVECAQHIGKLFRRSGTLIKANRATAAYQSFGIFPLMVVCCCGQGDEDGRNRASGNFKTGRSSGSCNHQIRLAVSLPHVVNEGSYGDLCPRSSIGIKRR